MQNLLTNQEEKEDSGRNNHPFYTLLPTPIKLADLIFLTFLTKS